MKARAKTNGNDTQGSFSREIPAGESRANPGPDFLGKRLESIIGHEEERRRLARELHDGLNQQLAMLAVELGMLAQQVPETSATIRHQLFHLRDRAERFCNELRHMTHQLHPAALEHLGLVS